MIARLLLCPLLALAALICGCADDQTATAPPPSTVPDKPPTARALAQIRSTAATPFYWLGASHGSQRLTRATLTPTDPPDSIFQYGAPTCKPRVGCTYGLGVATLRGRDPDTTQHCWRSLGPALVLGCGDATAIQVFTGPVEVFLSSLAVRPARVALALRLKQQGTAAAAPLAGLAAPRRFSCQEAKNFPPAFRARLPAQLAPGAC